MLRSSMLLLVLLFVLCAFYAGQASAAPPTTPGPLLGSQASGSLFADLLQRPLTMAESSALTSSTYGARGTLMSAASAAGRVAGWAGVVMTGAQLLQMLAESSNGTDMVAIMPPNATRSGWPSGWADSDSPPAGQGSIAVASVYGSNGTWCTGGAVIGYHATPLAACQSSNSVRCGSTSPLPGAISYSGSSCFAGATHFWDYATMVGCPSGYTQSGSTCNPPASAVQWPSDGVVTWTYQCTTASPAVCTLVPHPRDPDRFTPVTPYVRSGTDEFGNPVTETYTPTGTNAEPRLTLDQKVQTTSQSSSSNNAPQTQTTQQSVTLDKSGTVTQVSSNTYNTTINNITSSTPVAQALAVTVNVPPLQLPTDYNREATQIEVRDKLKDIKKALTEDDPNSHTPDPEAKTLADVSGARLFSDSLWSGLKGWSVPGHTSVCPTPSFDLSGWQMGTHTLSAHCTIAADVWPILQAICLGMWGLVAGFIILRA